MSGLPPLDIPLDVRHALVRWLETRAELRAATHSGAVARAECAHRLATTKLEHAASGAVVELRELAERSWVAAALLAWLRVLEVGRDEAVALVVLEGVVRT